mgnify:CR=1 FL=1
MNLLKVTATSVMLLTWAAPAMAYIDPGSGSAIMSAIVGFLVAISLIVKTYFFKFKSFFQKKEKKPPIKKSDD